MEAFVKILPRYFKTRNYSSFVRQLNMYDFHKLKNAEGFSEFQHPKFKMGNFSELGNIKRKINEYTDVLETFRGDQKVMLNEYYKLRKNYEEVEESLNVIASQNKRLVDTNKDLVCKLYFFKKEYESRIKKVLFCFYMNNNYSNEQLNAKVKEVLTEADMMLMEDDDDVNCLLLCHKIKSVVKQFAKRLIFSPEKNTAVLDKLVEIYIRHLNENIATEKMTINYKTIMKDMFKEEVEDPMLVLPANESVVGFSKKMKTGMNIFAPSSVKSENDLGIFNKGLTEDNLSDVDSKSESFNEGNLLCEITRKLANTTQSVNESFIGSEASSLHLFSPKSESGEVLKF